MDRYFWAVVGLAFFARAFVLLAAGPDPGIAITWDSPSYIEPARELRHQGRFARIEENALIPETYRTPGYPLFLVPFLRSDETLNHRGVQWTQVLLNSFSAGLVYLAALALWKHSKSALLAGAACALDFVNAIHCLFVLTDILFVFFLCGVLYALTRERYGVAGLLCAIAALVRPAGVYYPLGLALLLLVSFIRGGWTKSKNRNLALFVGLSLVPIGLWMARNHAVTGRWMFSAVQEANLFRVRVALVEAQKESISYEKALAQVESHYEASQAASAQEWASRYLMTHWKEYAILMAKDMVKLFSGNSMKVAAWAFLNDAQYDPDVTPAHLSSSPITQARELAGRHPVLGFSLAVYLIFLVSVYVLSLAGLWRVGTEQNWMLAAILVSSAVYFTVITLGVDAQARYRLPVMPALFLFAGGGYKMLFMKKENL